MIGPNRTKEKLLAGETVFGCFLRYADPGFVEFLGYQGFDFLAFDAEHGTIEPRDCESLVRAAELRAVTPIVRVPNGERTTLQRFLDTGVQGVHVPVVERRADAEQIVRFVKYGPQGVRGLAGVRAAAYGQEPVADYVVAANRATLIMVHIETRDAVERLDEIAPVPGLDVLFIGPTDLSQSYGVPGQRTHPLVIEAGERIIAAARTAGIAAGIVVPDAEAATAWQERGVRYVTILAESLLARASRGFLEEAGKR